MRNCFDALRAAAAVAVVIAIAPLAVAQTTTGRLIGSVVDADGGVLPGVTVSADSPAQIGGVRVAITDTDGEFSFIGLAPGVYRVRADLAGFAPREVAGVKVNLGGATPVRLVLVGASFGGEIEVTAETPVIDPTQVNAEQVFSEQYLQNASIGSAGRSYQSILTQAPGVALSSGAGGNPSVYGSTLGENAWYIDGIDTTDPVTATFGTNFNFDAIQEVQFQTGGFEAEYGRATGGIINLVTKSGGNQFSGTADVRYRDDGFQESGDHFDADRQDSEFEQLGLTLGGPIVRDRAWFFASHEYVSSVTTPFGSVTSTDFVGNYSLVKGTWQVGPEWRLVGKWSGDPAEVDNANADLLVAPEAAYFQEQGGDIFSVELSSVLSESVLWNTTAGINRQELNSFPQDGDLATLAHINQDTGEQYGNYLNQQYSERDRDDLATNLTWFVDDLGGSHELKVGFEYTSLRFESANCSTGTPGGVPCTEGIDGLYFWDLLADPANPSSDNVPYVLWVNSDVGFLEHNGDMQTVYAQDAWRPLSNLTVKAGVRYDNAAYDNDTGTEIADLARLQPRLGFAWDLTGDARNVVRGSWGRFMHPNALTLPSFARTGLTTSEAWLSCSTIVGVGSADECQAFADQSGFDWRTDPESFDSNGWVLTPGNVFGSAPNEIVSDLDATYADEIILSYERQLYDETSIEVSWIDKTTEDIFEDTCDGNLGGPSPDASCNSYIMANLPELSRDYRGAVVKLETRAWSWLSLLASYTWSESEGSVEYTQNAGAAFDVFPTHYENRFGFLSDHREHRVKLNGYALLPYDLTVGFSGFWSSDFRWEPRADSGDSGGEWNGIQLPTIPYGVYLVEPRGSREGADAYQVDLQLTKGFELGAVRLEVIGSVINALSSEYATEVCDDISGCSVEGEAFAPGDNIEFNNPRRYEIGFRVEF